MSDVTLYAYIKDTACTKCGSADLADRFHRKPVTEFGSGPDCNVGDLCWFTRAEHIRRYCRGCGHQWACVPLDAQEGGLSGR